MVKVFFKFLTWTSDHRRLWNGIVSQTFPWSKRNCGLRRWLKNIHHSIFNSPLNSSIFSVGNANELLIRYKSQSMGNEKVIWRFDCVSVEAWEWVFAPLQNLLAFEVELDNSTVAVSVSHEEVTILKRCDSCWLAEKFRWSSGPKSFAQNKFRSSCGVIDVETENLMKRWRWRHKRC